jgi:hypothetical protein
MTCLSGSTAETCADPRHLGRIKLKARVLSEPSLHFISRGRLSPSRCLKYGHHTATWATADLGNILALCPLALAAVMIQKTSPRL